VGDHDMLGVFERALDQRSGERVVVGDDHAPRCGCRRPAGRPDSHGALMPAR
jgi:hypothetical protein